MIQTTEEPQFLMSMDPNFHPKELMKVIVYGTLKKGYGNHRVLGSAEFEREVSVPGFRLAYSSGDSGFPVAIPDANSTIVGELYDISSNPEMILEHLDWLEAEGRMYFRRQIMGSCLNTQEKMYAYMYIGNKEFWKFDELSSCPVNDFGFFFWG